MKRKKEIKWNRKRNFGLNRVKKKSICIRIDTTIESKGRQFKSIIPSDLILKSNAFAKTTRRRVRVDQISPELNCMVMSLIQIFT